MKKVTVLLLVLCAAAALAAGLVACGGTASSSATSPAATSTVGNGQGGSGGAGDTGGAPAGRDTSTLALALHGHWKTSKDAATGGGGAARENNMYFDGKTCVSVPTGGNTVLFNYQVKSEDAAVKEMVLTIHRQKADGSAKPEAQDVRITFLNDTYTQFMTAGVTFDYVGPEERP